MQPFLTTLDLSNALLAYETRSLDVHTHTWLDALTQGIPVFSRHRIPFTLAYQLVIRKIIKEDNLLKCHGSLLNMLLSFCCIEAHLLLRHFLEENQSLVRYLTLL
jgi:hypothetical protein